MPLIIFTFAFNSETKEGTFAGNVEPQTALSILQNLVIANAVNKATSSAIKEDKTPDSKKP